MPMLRPILTLLTVTGIAVGTYALMRNDSQTAAPDSPRDRRGGGGPATVVVDQVRRADFPVYLEGVGTAKARNSVVVRPQVEGRLVSIKFREGQDVKKGALLAQIDPVTFQAQLDQARARKAINESLLATANRDLARYEKVGTLAVTEKTVDTQRALVAQYEAQVKADTAAIENQTAILGYTEIRAPIDGRTGIRNIDEGNLIRSGDPAGIVTITEVRPISVLFTLPQQELPKLTKALANAALPVEAYTTDSKLLLDSGTLQVVDNQVDPQTGTIRIKADLPNEKYQIWPGQFVNVRLLVDTVKDATIVPVAAVQRGPNGAFVYLVEEGETVKLRPVNITHQDEKNALVADGLNAGEKIVTVGFGRLEDGAKVRISPTAAPGEKPSSDLIKSTPEANAPASGPAYAGGAVQPQNVPAANATSTDALTLPASASPDTASGKRHHHRSIEKGDGRPSGSGTVQ